MTDQATRPPARRNRRAPYLIMETTTRDVPQDVIAES